MAELDVRTVKDVFNSMTQEQKNATFFLVNEATKLKEGDLDEGQA